MKAETKHDLMSSLEDALHYNAVVSYGMKSRFTIFITQFFKKAFLKMFLEATLCTKTYLVAPTRLVSVITVKIFNG